MQRSWFIGIVVRKEKNVGFAGGETARKPHPAPFRYGKGKGLLHFRHDEAVRSISAAIDDVDLSFVGVEKDEELVT